MTRDIEAIFVDLGNTLRILLKDDEHQACARREIVQLVGTEEDPVSFLEKINERYKVYRKWAFENLSEAPESELWTRWLVPEFPAERIAPLGGELTYQFRQSMGRRVVVEGGREVLEELKHRGYTLGIISNLIGTREIPEWLEQDGLTQYFPAVVLSSIFGRRKPGPEIFWEAARRIGVEPARAAYVADNPSRDVPGSRRAGFGMVIIMLEPAELEKKDLTGENKPDLVIHRLSQLLDVFPPRQCSGDDR